MQWQDENIADGMKVIRLLIVDDDPVTYNELSDNAENDGFEVYVAKSGFEALEVCPRFQPDIILLDVVMTGMDGFQVYREIRKVSMVPIIFISVKEKTEERIMGLDMGADDYITKPFCGREVMARVRAVLRRIKGSQNWDQTKTFSIGNLSINIETCTVFVEDTKLNMTKKEVDTMWLLARNPNRVFTREEIQEYLWGEEYLGDGRSLDSHIKRLRSKLREVDHAGWDIKTIWGLGYKFEIEN